MKKNKYLPINKHIKTKRKYGKTKHIKTKRKHIKTKRKYGKTKCKYGKTKCKYGKTKRKYGKNKRKYRNILHDGGTGSKSLICDEYDKYNSDRKNKVILNRVDTTIKKYIKHLTTNRDIKPCDNV